MLITIKERLLDIKKLADRVEMRTKTMAVVISPVSIVYTSFLQYSQRALLVLVAHGGRFAQNSKEEESNARWSYNHGDRSGSHCGELHNLSYRDRGRRGDSAGYQCESVHRSGLYGQDRAHAGIRRSAVRGRRCDVLRRQGDVSQLTGLVSASHRSVLRCWAVASCKGVVLNTKHWTPATVELSQHTFTNRLYPIKRNMKGLLKGTKCHEQLDNGRVRY